MKRILASLLTLCIVMTMLSLAIPVNALEPIVREVTLGNNAVDNYNEICSYIDDANENQLITIKIANPGTYEVHSNGGEGAIRLKSNIVLDLNGSTLVRSGDMSNILQNAALDGSYKNGRGYSQTSNITVKNGTLDGNSSISKQVNLVNFGHAQGITIEDVTFKNCYNGHLIELSGCKDVTISNCIFTGFTPSSTSTEYEEKEAVQLDICGGTEWNGVYYGDETVCQNITVTGCKFQNYPSGVGNHHTLTGKHNKNIRIINNTFTNSLSYKGIAIWAYAFDNSIIQDNIITGNYTGGIRVSGGSVDVIHNTLSNVPYEPLWVTVSNSYNTAGNSAKTSEVVSAGTIKNNELTAKGAYIGLKIFSGSKLTEISDNTISSTGESAVACSSDTNLVTTIGTIKNNTITSTSSTSGKNFGLSLASGTKVTTISGNTISAKGYALRITSGSTVSNINSNTSITSSGGDAILVTGDGCAVTNIKSNKKITSTAGNGINLSKGTIGTIAYNTISAKTEAGIRAASNSVITSVVDNTITATKGDGILVTGATIKNITNNTIKNCSTNGINAASTAKIGKVQGNTITGNKGYGVWIKNANITVGMGQNNYSSNTNGNERISAKVTKLHPSNLPAPTLKAPANTCGGVKISWSSVKFAEKYRVYYKTSSGWTKLADTTSTSYTHKGSSGTTYTYTVRTITSDGKSATGAYNTKGVSIKYIAAPKAKAANAKGSIKVSWPASKGASKYRVFYKTSSSGSWKKLGDTTGTSYSYKSVSSGKTYYFTVRCLDANGKYISSYYSSGVAIKYLAPPTVKTSKVSGGVKLSWSKPAGASGYYIYRKAGSGSFTKIASTTSTAYTDKTAKKGTTYTYAVKAYSGSYTGAYIAKSIKA